MSLMALFLLHRGVLESEGHVNRGAVIVIFCLSIVWASQQDKQIVGRKMIPLFFFLIFCIVCCLVS